MPKSAPIELQEVGRNCFCLQSRMTARILTRQYNAVLAPHDLEITEFSLLIAIKQGVDSSITNLAERLAFERSTLVRSLKRIVERGLVTNVATKGRAVQYAVTKEGDRILSKAMPSWVEAQEAIKQNLLADVEPEKVLQTLRYLRKASK